MRDRRRLIEWGKDLLILLLSVSAVFLAARSLFSTSLAGRSGDTWISRVAQWLDGSRTVLGPDPVRENREVPVSPVRIVITNDQLARYGVQYDTAAADTVFRSVFSVLGEALTSAGTPQSVPAVRWEQAMTQCPGICYDLLGDYPLETLLAWLEQGSVNPSLAGSARRVLLVREDGDARLYCRTQDGVCTVSALPSSLLTRFSSVVDGWSANSVSYACELGTDTSLSRISPCVLLGSDAPVLPVFRAQSALDAPGDARALLALLSGFEVLGFSSVATSTPYLSAGGEWVIPDGSDQLRLDAAGTLSFHADAAEYARYPVSCAGELPTLTEMLDTVEPIAAGTVGRSCGDARLYLMGVRELGDGQWQIDFGYCLSGAAVSPGSGGYAARFLIRGTAVTEFTLRFRSYSAAGESEKLLPEEQAAAAALALNGQGRELIVRYEDSGAEIVRPVWTVQ